MPQSDSDLQILAEARERARAVLDSLTGDAAEFGASPRFVEGAACCEDAAESARRLIAELDAQLDPDTSPEGQPRP